VSRAISIHLLDPSVVGDTAMLIKVNKELEKIVAADYPLKWGVVPNEEAGKVYDECGFADKKAILKYRPEKTVHLYDCDGYRNYMLATWSRAPDTSPNSSFVSTPRASCFSIRGAKPKAKSLISKTLRLSAAL
jgi:hypothetical protein